MRFLNNIYSLIIFIGFIMFILLNSFFGEKGLMNVFSLKNELREMKEYNQGLREENDKLKDYIYLLKNDQGFIERAAREELGLVRDKELIYIFKNN